MTAPAADVKRQCRECRQAFVPRGWPIPSCCPRCLEAIRLAVELGFCADPSRLKATLRDRAEVRSSLCVVDEPERAKATTEP